MNPIPIPTRAAFLKEIETTRHIAQSKNSNSSGVNKLCDAAVELFDEGDFKNAAGLLATAACLADPISESMFRKSLTMIALTMAMQAEAREARQPA